MQSLSREILSESNASFRFIAQYQNALHCVRPLDMIMSLNVLFDDDLSSNPYVKAVTWTSYSSSAITDTRHAISSCEDDSSRETLQTVKACMFATHPRGRDCPTLLSATGSRHFHVRSIPSLALYDALSGEDTSFLVDGSRLTA